MSAVTDRGKGVLESAAGSLGCELIPRTQRFGLEFVAGSVDPRLDCGRSQLSATPVNAGALSYIGAFQELSRVVSRVAGSLLAAPIRRTADRGRPGDGDSSDPAVADLGARRTARFAREGTSTELYGAGSLRRA